MRYSLLALAVALTSSAVLSTGCQEPISCTTEARTSIVLEVVDAETGEDVDAMVTFQVDGEASQEALRSGSEYYLGEEEEGTFVVTVSVDGYETMMREYEVTSGECHVMTVETTIELTRSA
jgi:hypothetical protein